MTFVVDTDVLADHLRGVPEATDAVAAALGSGRRVAASVLTRIELRRGARPHELAAIEALEILVEWVPVDHEIAELAARQAEVHGGAGSLLDACDFAVAATAERLRADLLTRDVQHFPMFPDLAAPY